MLRREFIGGAVSSTISVPKKTRNLQDLISQIEAAAHSELGGLQKVTVRFDPLDAKVPLMIIALRV
jgi:hypothetical protein